MQREAGKEPVLAGLKPAESDPCDADEAGLLRDDLNIAEGVWSSATYLRARSSTCWSAFANRLSSENWPQECHRLRLTNLAPHRGQIQISGSTCSA